MATEILSIKEIISSQSQKELTLNEALRQLEGQLVRVLSRDLSAPPGSPTAGDTYIVAAGGSGAWAGKDKHIAHWFGGAWVTYAPKEGMRLWVNAEDIVVVYDGTAWVDLSTLGQVTVSDNDTEGGYLNTKLIAGDGITLTEGNDGGNETLTIALDAQPHIVALFLPGLPAAEATVFVHYVVEAFTLPASLTGSRGGAEVAATAQTVFSLKKNGTEFGTATVAASGTTVSFAAASETSFAVGDKLSVVSPAQDASLEGLGISLRGSR